MKRDQADFKLDVDDELRHIFAMRGQSVGESARNGPFALSVHPTGCALHVAEATLREAIRVGALFLWEVDLETGRRRYEDDVALLLGHPRPRSVDEMQFIAAMEPADRATESVSFTRALNPDGEVCSWTCRLNGVDGVQRVVEASGHGFFDESGRMARFSGVLRDVTEVTRQRELAEDRALFAEQMVGIVSHDLRNPLSAVLMGIQILSRGESDPKRLLTLERTSCAAQRANRLIEELLDFTMARVGPGLRPVREPLDLHGLVFGVVDELELAYPDSVFAHLAARPWQIDRGRGSPFAIGRQSLA